MTDDHQDDQSVEELAEAASRNGPAHMAASFMYAVLELNDLAAAWPLADAQLRLVVAQGWLWANRTDPIVVPYDLDEAAGGLAASGVAHPLWEPFAATTMRELKDTWAGMTMAGLSIAGRPHAVGVGLERVILVDTGGDALVDDRPIEVANGAQFIMRSTSNGWRVAAIGTRLHVPGWPPTAVEPVA